MLCISKASDKIDLINKMKQDSDGWMWELEWENQVWKRKVEGIEGGNTSRDN